jgi:hypothetical protein
VTVYATGPGSPPTASNLNFVAAQTTSNMVVVPVGAGGKVSLYNGSGGTVQLVADVAGWYAKANAVPGPVTGTSAVPTANSIALSWANPPSDSVTGVMIRRSQGATPPASPAAGLLVSNAVYPATSFNDTGLSTGIQYSYALFAHNSDPVYSTGVPVTATTTAPGTGAVSGLVTDGEVPITGFRVSMCRCTPRLPWGGRTPLSRQPMAAIRCPGLHLPATTRCASSPASRSAGPRMAPGI